MTIKKKKESMPNMGLLSCHSKELKSAIKQLENHCQKEHKEDCFNCHHYYGNNIGLICDIGLLTTFSKKMENALRRDYNVNK